MADQLQFYVDLENSAGTKQGSGPLTSVTRWRYTTRLDRAGSIDFAFAASDAQADQATATRIAKAYALLGNTWTEVGAGIIDQRSVQPDNSGRVLVQASGRDLIGELSYRSVGDLEIGEGSGATLSSSLTSIGTVASGQGWTFSASGTPDNDYFYQRFGGESVLGALILLADRSQTHFYRSADRTLTFRSTWTDSGIRAIQAPLDDDLSADQCAILDLSQQVDTHELLTRIIPYGGGQGAARLTLAATNRTAPAGYTLDKVNNYIQATSAHSTYGLRNHPEVEFKDITPISNTDADLQAAANMLFDAALEELKRRSTLATQRTYTLSVAGCQQLLRPMQTIRVVYRDVEQGIDIDEDLYILEATWEMGPDGVGTTDLVVSTQDRWPQNDATVVSERMAEGRVFQAHPQMNANSYVLPFTKNMDGTENASFRFRLGNEIVTVQQALFEFQLLPFESTVSTVAVKNATSGSGELTSSTPSTNSSGNPSNDTSGTPSTNTSGQASGNTGTPSTNTSGGPSVTDTGGATGNTSAPSTNTSGSATGNTGSPSNNTSGSPSTNTSGSPSTNTSGAASGSTGFPSFNFSGGPDTNTSGGSGTLTTGSPEGDDIVSGGQHTHGVDVEVTGTGSAVYFEENGDFSNFYIQSGTGGRVPVTVSGDHTHDLGNHTHDLSSHVHDLGNHGHDLANHTHDLGNHTHTLGNHTHDLGNHTHSLGSHTHSLNNHTHTLGSHTHGLNSHTHSLGNHTHTLGNHTHSLNNHTHSLGNHTHSLGNHTHDVTPELNTVYGIFRDSANNTFDLAALDYRVNGGTWTALSGATDAGDGWYQVDITSSVQNSTTFRPTQTNNLIEIRGTNPTESLSNIQVAGSEGLYADVTAPTDIVTGNTVTVTGTTAYNGTYTVIDVTNNGATDRITLEGGNWSGGASESSGTLTVLLTATIDAQLAVRNVIQAISYQT